jgi:PAS domain S-box-containing protein
MFAKATVRDSSDGQASIPGAIVPLLFVVLTILLYFLGNHTVYESKPFLAVINILFLSALPFAVAYISSTSYLKSGLLQLLFLGGAMITFGICNLIAAGGILWVSSPEWTNFLVTIHNSGALVFAMITLAASIIASTRTSRFEPSLKRRKLNISTAYVGAVILAIFLAALTLSNDIPSFVVSGGFTLLRQSVLAASIILLTLSSVVFGKKYFGSKSSIVYWYSLGLALIAIGFLAILIEPRLGTPLSWTGRAAQYVGCIFFVVATLNKSPKNDANENWVEAFSPNRNQLNSLFSKMLDGFAYQRIVTDANGKPLDYVFLEVNDAFEKATGLRKENVVGKKATEVLPGIERDPAGWIDVYSRVALTGESIQFENYAESLGKWFRVSAYSPQKGYFVTLFEDITDRKKAEKAVEESEKRFRIVIENSRDGINMLDLKTGKYVFMSPAQVKLTGFSAEEINNISTQEAYERTYPEDREITITQQKRVAAGEDVLEPVEYRWKVKSGEYRWFSDSRKLVRDENGQPIAMVGVSRDITRRKKAEEEIQNLNKRFEMAQHAARAGVWVWDVNTGHIEWSIEMFRLFGLDPKTTVASFDIWNSVLHSEDRENAGAKIEEALKTHSFLNNEYRIVRPNKKVVWINALGQGEYNDKNEPIRMTGICIDVSERKRAEEELIQAQLKIKEYAKNLERLVEERTKQLKDSERLAAIGATAGMVGHDIRNPLQAITSDVYLAKIELVTTQETEAKINALESLDEIEKNVTYINKIVADLQDFARPFKPITKEINVKNIINDLLNNNGIPSNIKVKVKVQKEVGEVLSDPDLLKRILGNLVTNAIQAMPNGGNLTINGNLQAKDMVITVEDTGVGIPEEAREKLFTPLFTTKSKGQGFGLAVVKRMTEALGGVVRYESEEGKGTKFIIRLPCAENLLNKE